MLTEKMLQNLDLFLNLGIAFFVLSFVILVVIAWLSFFSYLDKCDKEKKQKDEIYISDEIERHLGKKLSAKECALMNIEGDIKYIREKLKENK